jgi:hypothetical protein
MKKHHVLNSASEVNATVEVIPAGQAPTGSLCLLRLAKQYPWMFDEPHPGMEMPIVWFAVFEELCADISKQLGSNKRGFHWRQLTREGSRPFWYWRMGEEMDLCVGMVRSLTGVSFTAMNPDSDPQNKVRDAVTDLVRMAQARAYVCGMLSLAKGEKA